MTFSQKRKQERSDIIEKWTLNFWFWDPHRPKCIVNSGSGIYSAVSIVLRVRTLNITVIILRLCLTNRKPPCLNTSEFAFEILYVFFGRVPPQMLFLKTIAIFFLPLLLPPFSLNKIRNLSKDFQFLSSWHLFAASLCKHQTFILSLPCPFVIFPFI